MTIPPALPPPSPRLAPVAATSGGGDGIAIEAVAAVPAMLALGTAADHVEGGTVALTVTEIGTSTGGLNILTPRGREV